MKSKDMNPVAPAHRCAGINHGDAGRVLSGKQAALRREAAEPPPYMPPLPHPDPDPEPIPDPEDDDSQPLPVVDPTLH